MPITRVTKASDVYFYALQAVYVQASLLYITLVISTLFCILKLKAFYLTKVGYCEMGYRQNFRILKQFKAILIISTYTVQFKAYLINLIT